MINYVIFILSKQVQIHNNIVGTEIKIIGDTNTNVFLAAPSGYNLEYIKNGSWWSANTFGEYSDFWHSDWQ